MTRQGFIDFNTKLSPENSRKASSYAMAIRILDDYSVVLSSVLRENETKAYYDKHFGCIDGQKMTMPTEYLPKRDNGICCMLSECRASKNTRATFN